MFTSCGWFFDDLAGLEPVQNLRYAYRAIQLVQPWARCDLTEGLLAHLRQAKPNDPHYPTGAEVWREMVVPASLSMPQAAAHLAASQILEIPEILNEFPLLNQTFSAELISENGFKLLTGTADLKDLRLGAGEKYCFLALLSPDRDLTIAVGELSPQWKENVLKLWDQGADCLKRSLPELGTVFTLDDLWPSVRQTILNQEVSGFFEDLRRYTQTSFQHHQKLLTSYRRPDSSITFMDRFIFRVMAEADLKKFTQLMETGEPIDLANLEALFSRESRDRNSGNTAIIQKAAADYLLKLLTLLPQKPRASLLSELLKLTQLLEKYPDSTNLWASQNYWYQLWNNVVFVQSLTPTDLALFIKVGESLGFGPAVL
jgi:hypothetical protein